MSRVHLVSQLIVVLNLICLISCQNVTVNRRSDREEVSGEQNLTRRSDNILLDGIQYLPECGILCKLHKFTSHLPPVMINFNHQYQNYIPIEPFVHHQPEFHGELHDLQPHAAELHHSDLYSDLHSDLSLHSKFLPDLPVHHHFGHLGLPAHHLGLASDFHQTGAAQLAPEQLHHNQLETNSIESNSIETNQINSNQVNLNQMNLNQVNPNQVNLNQVNSNYVNPNQVNLNHMNLNQVNSNQENAISSNPPPPPANQINANNQQTSGHQLQTSASTISNNNQHVKIEAIQQMFSQYESKNPVTIIEENFPLPENYNSIGPIETHSSSVRPLFVPEKHELKRPHELEDVRSNFIDYQPFHPSPHFQPPPFNHHSYPHFHSSHHHQSPYLDKLNRDVSMYSKKPNIEM